MTAEKRQFAMGFSECVRECADSHERGKSGDRQDPLRPFPTGGDDS
jgi:hypothetical protein